ncbi:MAG: D-alanine--D-alanine ligase [Holosporales bacterium]|jgi:D-alanine-D-alanine ligase|nr:D-alanine--D-alanine ligase [Holosporales bacterium]
MRITVLKGGWSSERDISLKSAAFVSEQLRKLGHKIYELDIPSKNLRYITDQLYDSAPDFIFNALHGYGGEDGVIQGVLEVFGVPYNTTGVLGSAISFHKSVCKNIVSFHGVKVIDGYDIPAKEIYNINRPGGIKMDYPFIVKPAENGSSIGVSLITSTCDLANFMNLEWTHGQDIVVERYIEGREFSVLIMKGRVIGAVEIISRNRFYDYNSKYDENGSTHLCNFDLDKKTKEKMYKMAVKAFNTCHCRGISRADFKYDGTDVYFLELNTQPGMTEASLVPDIAKFYCIEIGSILIDGQFNKSTN